MEPVSFFVNGEERTVLAEADWTLLYILREKLGLTGAKCGCDTHTCGACRVILDGRAVNSCSVKAASLQGRRVESCTPSSRPLLTRGPCSAASVRRA